MPKPNRRIDVGQAPAAKPHEEVPAPAPAPAPATVSEALEVNVIPEMTAKDRVLLELSMTPPERTGPRDETEPPPPPPPRMYLYIPDQAFFEALYL